MNSTKSNTNNQINISCLGCTIRIIVMIFLITFWINFFKNWSRDTTAVDAVIKTTRDMARNIEYIWTGK